MAKFRFNVTVDSETVEQASQVMAERLGYDEDYGFEYTITTWRVLTDPDETATINQGKKEE